MKHQFLFLALAGLAGAAEHPRLLFSRRDLPAIRRRAVREPVRSMVAHLENTWQPDEMWGDNPSPYNHSFAAVNAAFLCTMTGLSYWADRSREHVAWMIDASGQWAVDCKGLRLYMHGRCVAMAYDMCYDAWDEQFRRRVSRELARHGDFIFRHGGRSQNRSKASNWQGARFSSAGLCFLASDEAADDARLKECWQRVQTYYDANFGPETKRNSGWNTEGLGYQYYALGNYCGPFTIAMIRRTGEDLRKTRPQLGNSFWTVYAATVPIAGGREDLGLRPDFGDDNPGTRGEGCFGMAFYFADKALHPGMKWCYDRLRGRRGDRTWDSEYAGGLYSILYYPVDLPEKNPMDIPAWRARFDDRGGNGLFTFRKSYTDKYDHVAQFFVKQRAPGGHSGPDCLSFRFIGENNFFATGGGRYGRGNVFWQSMNTLYPGDPGQTSRPKKATGKTIACRAWSDGGGYVIAAADRNDVHTKNMKRWFIASYDRRTRADAVYIVVDTSDNGRYWQLCALAPIKISPTENGFLMRGSDGATLRGTSLYHKGKLNVVTGVRKRGSDVRYKGEVVDKNSFVHLQSEDGNHLVVMTINTNGSPPRVSMTGKHVADCSVRVGGMTFRIREDSVTRKAE